jgi:hypothetical protein
MANKRAPINGRDQRLYRPAKVNILGPAQLLAPTMKLHALVKETMATDCEAIPSRQR